MAKKPSRTALFLGRYTHDRIINSLRERERVSDSSSGRYCLFGRRRSYYRCTSASCNVKKRVERSWNDPNIVVTTYEGQHTHPTPMTIQQQQQQMARGGLSQLPQGGGGGGGWFGTQVPSHHQLLTDDDHALGLLQDVVPSTTLIKNEELLEQEQERVMYLQTLV